MGIAGTSDSKEMSSNNSLTSEVTLEAFRNKTINEDLTRQRFTVSREDGCEELKKDILCCYKNPQVKLTAKPRVKNFNFLIFKHYSVFNILRNFNLLEKSFLKNTSKSGYCKIKKRVQIQLCSIFVVC